MPRQVAGESSEQTAGAARLAALQLPVAAPGWVPEPPEAGSGEPRSSEPPRPVSSAPPAPEVEPAASTVPAGVGDLARGWLKDRAPLWLHPAVDRANLTSTLTGAAALVAALVAVVMLVHHHVAGAAGAPYTSSVATAAGGAPAADPVPSSTAAGLDTESIVVDVAGRVRKPGLVTLPAGARVADAITAAGGPLRHRELAATNLAARVTDGQLLLVGVRPDAAATGGSDAGDPATSSSPGPVDLNSATLEELETLPGIGPVTGQKIIDWRTAHSGFTSIEQLQQVSGIGPATYAELAPLVTP